jgi:hypothetical protein
VVAILARVDDTGNGLEGVLGDLDEHGGLVVGLVPQDFQVEGGEQAGPEGGRQAGQRAGRKRTIITTELG